ncbi:MAG: alpha/beta hydrolase [Deltaproteobacteria bacterium]|nr:alpha/beta hydrolase [Deltaproteobacteria bacterium]
MSRGLRVETKLVDVRGLRIAVHELGELEAPPVLALHGFMDHGLSFRGVATALAGRLRLVAPDFRGHGRSDWVGPGCSYHFYDYYSDLLTVIDRMGLEDVSILGHSMGGSAACGLSALLEERVKAMVLLEGVGPPAEEADTAPDRLLRFALSLGRDWAQGDPESRRRGRRPMRSVEDAAERMRGLNPRLQRETALELAEDATEPAEGGRVWRFDPLHRAPSSRPFRADEFTSFLRRSQARVLSLLGAESELVLPDLEERHAALRDVRIGRVRGAGHNLHHDHPNVVAEAMVSWFLGPSHELPEGIDEVVQG